MRPQQIRNVALVGHSGSGKTTLAEALLFTAGVTNRMGRTEDGTTVTDFEPEEVDRGSSVSLAMAPFEWEGHKINLVDTPGYADFLGDVRAALRAVDLALFVVSAVDGVEVQTEEIWKMAAEEGIARAVFINKLDRERASFQATVDSLKEVFGTPIAPIQVPIGAEDSLRGVANLVGGHAFTYADGDPKATEADHAPDALHDQVEALHTALVEAVVETDDDMLEAYFEGTEPEGEELIAGMHSGMMAGAAFPVLCGSATGLIGIDRLAQFLVDYGPSPSERPEPPLVEGDGLPDDESVVAYVFKTMSDPYVGRISLFRVYCGTLSLDDHLENPVRGVKGRMHNLFTMRGKEHEDAKEVVPGDIAAVAKLETTLAGDTLRTPDVAAIIEPAEVPPPTFSLAVVPHAQADEEKLSTALQRAMDDDPTIVVERRSDTNETVVSGLGDAHVDVTLSRLRSRFGVEVDTHLPTIPYRETIKGRADVEGKHKKQSGGRGQFGVAFVRFEPSGDTDGYEFVDEIKGGSIPRQYIPAVDKGIQEALDRGIVAGFPVVGVRAIVYDGKYHSVDSDEMSFRMAGIQAVRAAAAKLQGALLEPIMDVTVRVPEDLMGDIIGDLNAKRGRVMGMDADGASRVVSAQVPLAEMQRYSIDLRSLTSGRGSFEMELSHYEEMPPQEAQKVIAAAEAADDD
ncbi:MAG: elongation factor G [Acidimicrobiia bacterium]|nr:elongation factor G [Acidimicrobiia bacterium]